MCAKLNKIYGLPGEPLKGKMHEKPVFISVFIQQSLVAVFNKSYELGSYRPRDYTQVRKRKWESEIFASNPLLTPEGREVWQTSIC